MKILVFKVKGKMKAAARENIFGSRSECKPGNWDISHLSFFYVEHREELVRHANRILHDRAKAEEITQEAFLKLMLASPELANEQHAVSYLHRAIKNLCIDHLRVVNRRPTFVVLDDATAEIETGWQTSFDHADSISAADDAAVVRQALSLLSHSERAALVMWEIEGRSTKEIARELGIKESSVRHTISRARSSLRRILSNLIIDEARGLTALDLLSSSYKKVSRVAEKSSRIAMSLVLLVVAFLGFNSLTGSEPIDTVIEFNSLTGSEPIDTALSAPLEESEADADVNQVKSTVNSSSIAGELPVNNPDEFIAELDFLNAQLNSAAVMLETLKLIEGNN